MGGSANLLKSIVVIQVSALAVRPKQSVGSCMLIDCRSGFGEDIASPPDIKSKVT